mmetsp:Transcript_23942/g.47615  ORF Transcript_23942/g.47615 Transcript_23942/m.47615 type:complete len:89 (-) Transcript_23942:180-446(-)
MTPTQREEKRPRKRAREGELDAESNRPKEAVSSYECLSNSFWTRLDAEEKCKEYESGAGPPRRRPVSPTQAEGASDYVRTKRMEDYED